MEKTFITIIVERNKFMKIFVEDILYLKANRCYSIIKITDVEYVLSKPLKEFEYILEFDGFIKVNRSYIVNTNKCIGFKAGRNSELTLINNEIIKPNHECIDNLKKLFQIQSQN